MMAVGRWLFAQVTADFLGFADRAAGAVQGDEVGFVWQLGQVAFKAGGVAVFDLTDEKQDAAIIGQGLFLKVQAIGEAFGQLKAGGAVAG
ncbi:hypothetical protein N4R57_05800 [Rhodobacteraceae bacterium D3-12]|nr:hypothetical protein N4R57_05800 [Rhodobacteraceae bacterium D3-12]